MRKMRVDSLELNMRKYYHEALSLPRARRHDSPTFPMTPVMGTREWIHGFAHQMMTGFTLGF